MRRLSRPCLCKENSDGFLAARLHRLARGSSRRPRSSHHRGLQHPRRQDLSRGAHPGRDVVLLEIGVLARNEPRFHHAGGDGRDCSAAWASARSRPSCCTAIPFNSAATPSGLSPWPGTRTCGCSTAAAGNGSWRDDRCRVTCRTFPRSPIRHRRRDRRRCGSAATMCASICGEPRRLLLDFRSPEEYSGERVSDYSFKTDHGAERTGRIPGAVHLYFKELLNEDDSFKSPERASSHACRRRHCAGKIRRGCLLLPAEPSRHHRLARARPNSRPAQRQNLRRLVDRMGQHRRLSDREVARRLPSVTAPAVLR